MSVMTAGRISVKYVNTSVTPWTPLNGCPTFCRNIKILLRKCAFVFTLMELKLSVEPMAMRLDSGMK